MTRKGDASCQEFSWEKKQLKLLYHICQSLGLEEGWENVYVILLLNASEGRNWGYPRQLDLLILPPLLCANWQGHNRQDGNQDWVLPLKIPNFFFPILYFISPSYEYVDIKWQQSHFIGILLVFWIGSHKRSMSLISCTSSSHSSHWKNGPRQTLSKRVKS